jgi:hypothetical protein
VPHRPLLHHFGKVDQTSPDADDIPMAGHESAAKAESEVASSTSSSTMADQAMERKEFPPLYQYWKVPTVIDKDIAAYSDTG